MMNSSDARARVNQLIRAQGRNSYEDILRAHSSVFEAGEDAIPFIREMLLKHDWSNAKRVELMQYLTCLMGVLHDIDEDASRKVAQEIISNGCHSVYKVRLNSICRFTLSDYLQRDFNDIQIYIAKSLNNSSHIGSHIETWLKNVPLHDLKGISRLYVVDKEQDDFLGKYTHILAKIILVWRCETTESPNSMLSTEYTLYHEIGHHNDKHVYDESFNHEEIADQYAVELFIKAHENIGDKKLRELFFAEIVGKAVQYSE